MDEEKQISQLDSENIEQNQAGSAVLPGLPDVQPPLLNYSITSSKNIICRNGAFVFCGNVGSIKMAGQEEEKVKSLEQRVKKLEEENASLHQRVTKLEKKRGVVDGNSNVKILAETAMCVDSSGCERITSSSTGFWITVKTPAGRSHEFKVLDNTTILDFKRMIERNTGTPATEQILAFRGRSLEHFQIMDCFGLRERDTVYMMVKARGGRVDWRKHGKLHRYWHII